MFASPLSVLPKYAEVAKPEDCLAHFEEAKAHWKKMMTLMGLNEQTIADEMNWLDNRKGLWLRMATPNSRTLTEAEEQDILDEAEADGPAFNPWPILISERAKA